MHLKVVEERTYHKRVPIILHQIEAERRLPPFSSNKKLAPPSSKPQNFFSDHLITTTTTTTLHATFSSPPSLTTFVDRNIESRRSTGQSSSRSCLHPYLYTHRHHHFPFMSFVSGGPRVYILHRHHHFPFMSFVSGGYIFYMSVEKDRCIEVVNMLKGSAHAVFVEMPKRRFLNLLQSWNWVDYRHMSW
ncbi:unnamed protein product [Lactuca virosa]|uniref:Uncharacterized protein n=1 Tax=Lactuca virosa TaxID=75947 RepID=A0AAU9NFV5_9ASTR|nr:unnamed protein product [Lactuca virosa]